MDPGLDPYLREFATDPITIGDPDDELVMNRHRSVAVLDHPDDAAEALPVSTRDSPASFVPGLQAGKLRR